MKKISGEVGIKCHQSCLVALVFCTKLYIKLAVSLCSFSQFSFPFNFRTANALVLKFATLPLSGLFSNNSSIGNGGSGPPLTHVFFSRFYV